MTNRKHWTIKLKECPYCCEKIEITQSGMDKQSPILRLIKLSKEHTKNCSNGKSGAIVNVTIRERNGNLITYKDGKIII